MLELKLLELEQVLVELEQVLVEASLAPVGLCRPVKAPVGRKHNTREALFYPCSPCSPETTANQYASVPAQRSRPTAARD